MKELLKMGQIVTEQNKVEAKRQLKLLKELGFTGVETNAIKQPFLKGYLKITKDSIEKFLLNQIPEQEKNKAITKWYFPFFKKRPHFLFIKIVRPAIL